MPVRIGWSYNILHLTAKHCAKTTLMETILSYYYQYHHTEMKKTWVRPPSPGLPYIRFTSRVFSSTWHNSQLYSCLQYCDTHIAHSITTDSHIQIHEYKILWSKVASKNVDCLCPIGYVYHYDYEPIKIGMIMIMYLLRSVQPIRLFMFTFRIGTDD